MLCAIPLQNVRNICYQDYKIFGLLALDYRIGFILTQNYQISGFRILVYYQVFKFFLDFIPNPDTNKYN